MHQPPSAPNHLTARQERFCELIAAGENQTDAWLKAGYRVSRGVARRNAAKALKCPGVKAKLAELRELRTKAAVATRDFKRAKLFEIMCDPKSRPADIIRAIEMDCRMAGHFEPEKVEVETGAKTLASIAERAKHVVSALNAFANRSHAGNSVGSSGLALPFASTGTPVAARRPDGSGG